MHPIPLLPSVRAFLATPRQLFIGGTWQEAASGRRFRVENPADESPIAEVAQGAAADVDAAVAAARAAFEGPWRRETP
ncbi:aldehyde dehydrogenase family protein, partial [Metapseudomonas otitidis]